MVDIARIIKRVYKCTTTGICENDMYHYEAEITQLIQATEGKTPKGEGVIFYEYDLNEVYISDNKLVVVVNPESSMRGKLLDSQSRVVEEFPKKR
ncbi:MAG: hypothetical protein KAJ10_13535 [Thermodesulfovibrionia bacterium]|nr:hypothetical protein [Thermodesulfovibrionia bacterium]